MPKSWTSKGFGPLITSTMRINGKTVDMCDEFGEQFLVWEKLFKGTAFRCLF